MINYNDLTNISDAYPSAKVNHQSDYYIYYLQHAEYNGEPVTVTWCFDKFYDDGDEIPTDEHPWCDNINIIDIS